MTFSIIDLLSAIPSVVWSGLIASLVTLSGVMISNANNTKRLLKQLAHDADQKEKDRLNSLRKEVYLKAAEETAKVGSFFGKIPSIDPVTTSLGEGLSEFNSASAKLQLIAQPETAIIAAELTVKYGEILLFLLQKSAPIHHINAQIKISNTFFENNQTEASRILTELKQLNELATKDTVKIEALKKSLNETQSLARHFADEIRKAYSLHEEALKDYTFALMEQFRLTIPLQDALMLAIRKELNLVSDSGKNGTNTREYFGRLSNSLRQVVKSLDSEK